MREIRLKNLNVAAVDRIVQHLTKLKPNTTLPLSKIIHRKTRGNPFIVLEFMQMIVMQKLLVYSTTSFRWTFDERQIELKTFLANSVADVVKSRIQQQSIRVQTLLKLTASLWSCFQIDHLLSILKRLEHCDDMLYVQNEQDLLDILQQAVNHGLLDRLADRNYKFLHDRIQESAYMLFFDEEERNRTHLRLGRATLSMRKENSMESSQWLLFLTADQLNKGSKYMEEKDELLELLRLNLEAGQTAKTMSAFVPAKNYLKMELTFFHAMTLVWISIINLRWNFTQSLLKCPRAWETTERATGLRTRWFGTPRIFRTNYLSIAVKLMRTTSRTILGMHL